MSHLLTTSLPIILPFFVHVPCTSYIKFLRAIKMAFDVKKYRNKC